jgi:hypothetical protein
MQTDPLTAPLPRSLVRPRPVYGRRGKLPEGPDVRRLECACGKLILRCDGDPRVSIEGYCRECKTHVIFESC